MPSVSDTTQPASRPTDGGDDATRDLGYYGGWKGVLSDLVAGVDLSAGAARAALRSILTGDATDAQLAGFIIALKMKGGAVPELTGMVDAMLDVSVPLTAPTGAIDIVGSGGAPTRAHHALSVSTMAAFVAAAAGATVCKHGSVRASSSSGSFDTLAALGVHGDLPPAAVETCIAEHGIGFAFAKRYHPAMRYAGPVRSELGVPTTFNFLGPLANPARVRREVLGVSDPSMAPRVAEVLAARNNEHSLVVHGTDRLDEITTTDTTRIYEVRDGQVTDEYLLDPTELGIDRANRVDLLGGSPEHNAELFEAMVEGDGSGPKADIVVLNAAAGLLVAGVTASWSEGIEAARDALADGAAAAKLSAVVATTRRLAAELADTATH